MEDKEAVYWMLELCQRGLQGISASAAKGSDTGDGQDMSLVRLAHRRSSFCPASKAVANMRQCFVPLKKVVACVYSRANFANAIALA